MVIYADMVFLLNLFIDFTLLLLTSAIRRQRVPFWRMSCGALLGAVYSILHLWPQFAFTYTFPAKVLFSIFMVGVTFGYSTPIAFARSLGVFYTTSFVIGGGMFALHYVMTGEGTVAGGIFLSRSTGWGSPVSWLFVLVSFPFVWLYARVSFRSLQQRQAIHSYLTPVAIWIGEHRLECVGLIDTGNQLRDPISRAPVMMVELERIQTHLPEALTVMARTKAWHQHWDRLPAEWMTRVRLVPFRGVAAEGEMMVTLKPNRVEIRQQQDWVAAGKVLVGLDPGRLSSDGTYQAIIHPSCLPQAG
jgi:stage II sporulation protein GA (sporulation sigma-E factor processing peptidase)